MQTAVGLKHVSLRVLRAELKFAFMGWKDAWREAVLDRLVGKHKVLAWRLLCSCVDRAR